MEKFELYVETDTFHGVVKAYYQQTVDKKNIYIYI